MKPLAILLLCSVVLCAHAQEPATLKLTKTVPLPGVKGRFDHFALDAKGHRLFIAALGNNTLEVLDIAAGKSGKTGDVKPKYVLKRLLGELRAATKAKGAKSELAYPLTFAVILSGMAVLRVPRLHKEL